MLPRKRLLEKISNNYRFKQKDLNFGTVISFLTSVLVCVQIPKSYHIYANTMIRICWIVKRFVSTVQGYAI